ncbi:MAG TPA: hypothetical protein VF597_00605 [Candidatus Saccharimonadales bacterium]|jgi:hypothetical protein
MDTLLGSIATIHRGASRVSYVMEGHVIVARVSRQLRRRDEKVTIKVLCNGERARRTKPDLPANIEFIGWYGGRNANEHANEGFVVRVRE